ncbi:FHA domain-containing protein [Mycetocola reblochoni]|uniref:FHA domain-containing protein n=2 Tax=Mycetocola reblochoni TaxID=331618 RepID=A0A1R4ID52_9MICO|nr:FHA domain-containing protein [Mycetocola reblochoni]SJN17666.1 hypothetical protein FM119_01090 [Mycetocola reblochoni REB411]
MTVCEYRPAAPGEWLLVVGAERLVAVRGAGPATAAATAAGIAAATDPASVIDALAPGGIATLLDFVIVLRDERGARLLHRGAGPIWILREAREPELDEAGPLIGWAERRLEPRTHVIGGAASAEDAVGAERAGELLPLGDGVAWASAFAVPVGGETDGDGGGTGRNGDGTDDDGGGANGVGRDGDGGSGGGSPGGGQGARSGAAGQADDGGRRRGPARDGGPGGSSEGIDEDLARTRVEPLTPADGVARVSAIDALAAEAVATAHAGAPVSPPAAEGTAEDSRASAIGPVPADPVPADPVPADPGAADPGAGSPVVDPPVRASLRPALPAALDRIRIGEHDGRTQLATHLRAARGEARRRLVRERPRYALVLPGGARRVVDSAIILGRAPSIPADAGGTPAQLVVVGGDDISRSHVRIAAEGGTVVVTDLHSSNGTRVLADGKPPLSLRAGEATPIISPCRIDLGGGVELRVEAE